MMRRTSLAGAVAAAALALAACGGNSDKSDVTSVIKEIGKNPATLCTKNGSADLVKQLGGQATCEKAAKAGGGGGDPGVKVDSVKVDGSKATATVTSDSGSNKGKQETVHMVKEDGDWKLDTGQ